MDTRVLIIFLFYMLEKKVMAFDKIMDGKGKRLFREHSYKRLAEEGEDAEKLFKF